MTRFPARTAMISITLLTIVQIVCALFFVLELVTEVFGLRHWALPWEVREVLQVAASLGLIIGSAASLMLLRMTRNRIDTVQRQIQAASGAFFGMMEECFVEWGLSPSERDVAIFAVRGLSNTEIAALRQTSLPTVKSQMGSVFRKAGVTSRAQLLSAFIDILIDAGPAEDERRPAEPGGSVEAVN